MVGLCGRIEAARSLQKELDVLSNAMLSKKLELESMQITAKQIKEELQGSKRTQSLGSLPPHCLKLRQSMLASFLML